MGVFKKLGEGIADLSELNVQTFSGDLTSVIDKSNRIISGPQNPEGLRY